MNNEEKRQLKQKIQHGIIELIFNSIDKNNDQEYFLSLLYALEQIQFSLSKFDDLKF